jgi:hypothetical protein
MRCKSYFHYKDYFLSISYLFITAAARQSVATVSSRSRGDMVSSETATVTSWMPFLFPTRSQAASSSSTEKMKASEWHLHRAAMHRNLPPQQSEVQAQLSGGRDGPSWQIPPGRAPGWQLCIDDSSLELQARLDEEYGQLLEDHRILHEFIFPPLLQTLAVLTICLSTYITLYKMLSRSFTSTGTSQVTSTR